MSSRTRRLDDPARYLALASAAWRELEEVERRLVIGLVLSGVVGWCAIVASEPLVLLALPLAVIAAVRVSLALRQPRPGEGADEIGLDEVDGWNLPAALRLSGAPSLELDPARVSAEERGTPAPPRAAAANESGERDLDVPERVPFLFDTGALAGLHKLREEESDDLPASSTELPDAHRSAPQEPVYEVREIVLGVPLTLDVKPGFLEATDAAFDVLEELDPEGLDIVRVLGGERETVWTYNRDAAMSERHARGVVDVFGHSATVGWQAAP